MNSKFESLTLVELKAELKKRHAKVSRRKKELVERYLVKYLTADQWKQDPQNQEGLNIMAMGLGGVGKTSVIRKLQQYNKANRERVVQNLYEYRERAVFTRAADKENQEASVPVYRRKAIDLGDIFIIVFAVNSPLSFRYAQELKEEICEIKGQDVPIIVVGNKSDRRLVSKRLVTYAYADLLVSLEWEKTYREVSATNDIGFNSLLGTILKQEAILRYRMKTEAIRTTVLPGRKVQSYKK